MKIEEMTYERHDRGERPWVLSAARILPDRRPRFCVQLLHGFSERKERWYPLMRFIAMCGGVALIHDLRGHGETEPAEKEKIKNPEDALASLGYDYEILRGDIDGIYSAYGDPWGEEIADPEGERLIPRFLFGHSMGALMAAVYAARNSACIDGLILSGLPHREKFASAGLAGLGMMSVFGGDACCPRGLNRRAFRRFNRYFKPEPESDGTFLWLTNDPAVRREFAADPICNRPHPIADYKNLLRLVRDVWKPAMWDRPKDPESVPVFLMAGENDPVAGGDEAVIYAEKFLKDMGFSSVDARMYRGMRHEIFTDEGREAAFGDLCRFALTHLPARGMTAGSGGVPAAGEKAPVPDVPAGEEEGSAAEIPVSEEKGSGTDTADTAEAPDARDEAE
jgi:alpha-beta hydrolase superfamily lysophospholipase